MRRFKRWWWRLVFFLLLIVPGSVRVAIDGQWWFLVPSIIGATGLVWLMWDDHRERQKATREREREGRHLDQRLDIHGQRLDDKDQRDQSLEHQVSWLIGQQTGSPEPLAASGTIRSAEPTIRANATLEPLSLRRRVYWWLVVKSGWLPPWHRR